LSLGSHPKAAWIEGHAAFFMPIRYMTKRPIIGAARSASFARIEQRRDDRSGPDTYGGTCPHALARRFNRSGGKIDLALILPLFGYGRCGDGGLCVYVGRAVFSLSHILAIYAPKQTQGKVGTEASTGLLHFAHPY
jgi:hypothetical protein